MTGVIIKKDRVREVIASLNKLVAKSVLIGIPDTTTERQPDEDDNGPLNNATLGYLHEFGSPANNIPARPFLIPGVHSAEAKCVAYLKKAAQAALDNKPGKVAEGFDAAGLIAQNSVRAKINSGAFVPLADATLAERARKGRKGAQAEIDSRRAGNAPSTATAKPLIDSGQLRNSITYVIRGK